MSKDIALCRKVEELSIEDWELRVHGLKSEAVDRTCVNEVISDDEYVEMTFLDENCWLGYNRRLLRWGPSRNCKIPKIIHLTYTRTLNQ